MVYIKGKIDSTFLNFVEFWGCLCATVYNVH